MWIRDSSAHWLKGDCSAVMRLGTDPRGTGAILGWVWGITMHVRSGSMCRA